MDLEPKLDKTILIEFTGVSGTGKTKLSGGVKDLLSTQGFLIRDAYEVILTFYGLNFIRPPLLRSVLIDLLAFPPSLHYLFTKEGSKLLGLAIYSIRSNARTFLIAVKLLRNFVKRIGVHILLTKLQHQPNQDNFIFCDEGVLHIAHNLFVHSHTPPDLNEVLRFSKIVPKPDLIIWVKAPQEKSLESILQRGHSRINGSPAAASSFVEHGYRTFEALFAEKSLRNKLLAIDNTLPVHVTVSTIAAHLLQQRAKKVNNA